MAQRSGRVSIVGMVVIGGALAVGLGVTGCVTVGHSNETCTNSGECAEGYICVNARCTVGTAGYSTTGKVCDAHSCAEDTDCPANFVCTGGECGCDEDSDCGASPWSCNAGICQFCGNDDDCPNPDQVCSSGSCQDPCENSFVCEDFFACTAGKCEFVGCETDVQCSLSHGDVRYKCDTTTTLCFEECSTDAECDDLTGGDWSGQVCNSGRCETVGCEDDADCQYHPGVGEFGATCVEPETP